jgi:hypothetical protein
MTFGNGAQGYGRTTVYDAFVALSLSVLMQMKPLSTVAIIALSHEQIHLADAECPMQSDRHGKSNGSHHRKDI